MPRIIYPHLQTILFRSSVHGPGMYHNSHEIVFQFRVCNCPRSRSHPDGKTWQFYYSGGVYTQTLSTEAVGNNYLAQPKLEGGFEEVMRFVRWIVTLPHYHNTFFFLQYICQSLAHSLIVAAAAAAVSVRHSSKKKFVSSCF